MNEFTQSIIRNLDIRDAILQLLSAIREGGKKSDRNFQREKELGEQILSKIKSSGSIGIERKIDNISTFLLRFCHVLSFFFISSPKNNG